MASLFTLKKDSDNPKDKIYLMFFHRVKGYSIRRVTKFRNTRDGWIDARRYLKQFEGKHASKDFIKEFDLEKENGLTFSLAFDKMFEVSQYKASTVRLYEYTRQYWLECQKDKFIKEYRVMDAKEFISFLRNKGLSQNTVSQHTRNLSHLWAWCIDCGLTSTNIFKNNVEPSSRAGPTSSCWSCMPRRRGVPR